MLVIPPPFAVPRLTVTYSRNVLPSPTTSSARTPPATAPLRADAKYNHHPTQRPRRPRRTLRPAHRPRAAPTRRSLHAHEFLAASFVRRLAFRGRIAVHHLAHERRLGGQIAVDRRLAFQFAEIAAPGQHVDFEPELIARNHGPPEARIVHGHKIEQLVLAVRHFLEQQQPAGLRHGFDDEHAGHDRFPRKMPLKMRFVDGPVLDADNPLQRLHFEDRIHHQKWIAMRQYLLDTVHVKNHPRSPSRRTHPPGKLRSYRRIAHYMRPSG